MLVLYAQVCLTICVAAFFCKIKETHVMKRPKSVFPSVKWKTPHGVSCHVVFFSQIHLIRFFKNFKCRWVDLGGKLSFVWTESGQLAAVEASLHNFLRVKAMC